MGKVFLLLPMYLKVTDYEPKKARAEKALAIQRLLHIFLFERSS